MLAWDRTHDWELQRFWGDRTRVTIQFRQQRPSVAELASVRRCLPQYRHMAPATVRATIGESGELPLGELFTPDALELIKAAEEQGLRVVAERASFVSYLPFDRTTGCAWLIEDEAEAAEVARAMLAAGVPVREVVE
jgi:hypothetical protein